MKCARRSDGSPPRLKLTTVQRLGGSEPALLMVAGTDPKPVGHDPDDRLRPSVDHDGATDDARIGAESAPPEALRSARRCSVTRRPIAEIFDLQSVSHRAHRRTEERHFGRSPAPRCRQGQSSRRCSSGTQPSRRMTGSDRPSRRSRVSWSGCGIPFGKRSHTMTRRSCGAVNGNGRRNVASASAKIALLAPMPSANVSAATNVKPGDAFI